MQFDKNANENARHLLRNQFAGMLAFATLTPLHFDGKTSNAVYEPHNTRENRAMQGRSAGAWM